MNVRAKDLTKEAPGSPKEKLGGYVCLPRMIDKCRAMINGTNGEFNFNCPLDKRLLEFKNIDAEEFKKYVSEGRSDEEILEWFNINGDFKTDEEIEKWSNQADRKDYATREDKKKWFIPYCEKLGLDPFKTSLFDYLDADDKASSS
ncbi:MAG: hypothetical protein A3G13_03270 [Candidatus Levybacteria bacterium RIFCSPLOWO2_12_FULL_37_7]|nr:MAG: hypothetical protein A2770_04835 [Candidatus Levybacteria bacterium RIFCSPHIGHO2_01_FULL_38_12]OGH50996.1 MAG: hypothetical protein A3G13_03270 [Candidatus Levybacteria bacterium RIFCSPLOWO2_12_FULL_37_7]